MVRVSSILIVLQKGLSGWVITGNPRSKPLLLRFGSMRIHSANCERRGTSFLLVLLPSLKASCEIMEPFDVAILVQQHRVYANGLV